MSAYVMNQYQMSTVMAYTSTAVVVKSWLQEAVSRPRPFLPPAKSLEEVDGLHWISRLGKNLCQLSAVQILFITVRIGQVTTHTTQFQLGGDAVRRHTD